MTTSVASVSIVQPPAALDISTQGEEVSTIDLTQPLAALVVFTTGHGTGIVVSTIGGAVKRMRNAMLAAELTTLLEMMVKCCPFPKAVPVLEEHLQKAQSVVDSVYEVVVSQLEAKLGAKLFQKAWKLALDQYSAPEAKFDENLPSTPRLVAELDMSLMYHRCLKEAMLLGYDFWMADNPTRDDHDIPIDLWPVLSGKADGYFSSPRYGTRAEQKPYIGAIGAYLVYWQKKALREALRGMMQSPCGPSMREMLRRQLGIMDSEVCGARRKVHEKKAKFDKKTRQWLKCVSEEQYQMRYIDTQQEMHHAFAANPHVQYILEYVEPDDALTFPVWLKAAIAADYDRFLALYYPLVTIEGAKWWDDLLSWAECCGRQHW
jgi:hypothetical protein